MKEENYLRSVVLYHTFRRWILTLQMISGLFLYLFILIQELDPNIVYNLNGLIIKGENDLKNLVLFYCNLIFIYLIFNDPLRILRKSNLGTFPILADNQTNNRTTKMKLIILVSVSNIGQIILFDLLIYYLPYTFEFVVIVIVMMVMSPVLYFGGKRIIREPSSPSILN